MIGHVIHNKNKIIMEKNIKQPTLVEGIDYEVSKEAGLEVTLSPGLIYSESRRPLLDDTAQCPDDDRQPEA